MANFVPKYVPMVPLMIQWIRNGSEIERKTAEADLLDMARFIDQHNKRVADAAEAKALQYTESMMKRLTDKKKDDQGNT
jgi:hypothetical protein